MFARELKVGDSILDTEEKAAKIRNMTFSDCMIAGRGLKSARAIEIEFEDGSKHFIHPGATVTLVK